MAFSSKKFFSPAKKPTQESKTNLEMLNYLWVDPPAGELKESLILPGHDRFSVD